LTDKRRPGTGWKQCDSTDDRGFKKLGWERGRRVKGKERGVRLGFKIVGSWKMAGVLKRENRIK